jgi:hypothetical protein
MPVDATAVDGLDSTTEAGELKVYGEVLGFVPIGSRDDA